MNTDLQAFDGWFKDNEWPAAPCPVCKLGQLAPAGDDAVQTVKSAASDRARDHPDWDPEWINGYFHGVLRCNRPGCKETCVVTGEYKVAYSAHGEYDELLRLRHALPPLPLVVTPKDTPVDVEARLTEASYVIWDDPASSANALRRCVEAILDDQNVNKTVLTKKRTRQRLTTQQRIVLLKSVDPLAAASLEAVKWVGNQGSHGSVSLTATDCIESAEYLAHALRLLYDKTDDEIARRVKAVNRSKGVRRRRK